jgi:flagellar basal body-associated protein FliL
MAADSKKREEAPQEVKNPGPTESKAKGMHSMILPLVIAAIIIGLGGLGIGGYFMFTQMKTAQAGSENGDGSGDTTGGDAEITSTDIFFEEFPEGIVNLQLSEDNPFTYLKHAFTLEVSDSKVLEELKTKLPKLYSKVATVMSNRVWTEVSTSSGREQLSREVMATINSELEEGTCIGIYFTTFIAQ